MGIDAGFISRSKWRRFNYQSQVMAQQVSPGPEGVMRLETTKDYGSIAQDVHFANPVLATAFFFFARARIAADIDPGLVSFTVRLYLWDLEWGDHSWTELDVRRGPGWTGACVYLDRAYAGPPQYNGTEPRRTLRAEIYMLTPRGAIEVKNTQFGVEANGFSEGL